MILKNKIYVLLFFTMITSCDMFITYSGGKGDQCTHNYSYGYPLCNGDLVCNFNTCEDPVEKGGRCEASVVEGVNICAEGLFCENNICVDDCQNMECGEFIPTGASCGTCKNGNLYCISGKCSDVKKCGDNCPEWINIPAGDFIMGNDDYYYSKPSHLVTLKAFEMTKSEITVAQYKECFLSGYCTSPNNNDPAYNWDKPGYENHPVNGATWSQAVDYCNWFETDLPTESQWEYAARGAGQNITFPWGEEEASCDYTVMNDGVYTTSVVIHPVGALSRDSLARPTFSII
ncbi:MAG: formylglycine-generating enzyme family protein [Deltaproteobacteria bacterium]|nr:formylglycine-generating enzyme family protein [Deltaproteobacteria bacterium]